MASIHKRPRSPYFHASFRNSDGKQILKSTRQKERGKAEQFAFEWERMAKAQGEGTLTKAFMQKSFEDVYEKLSGDKSKCPTTREFFAEWLALKTPGLAAGTARLYEFTMKRFLMTLGPQADLRLSTITAGHIENYIAARQGASVSPSTIASELSTVIRPAFRKAMNRGHILKDPAPAVDSPRGDHMERETFTSAEVEMMVDAASSEWKTAILTGYFTGARLGTCCRLKWENFDLVKDEIVFFPGKQRQGKKKELHVPLNAQLKEHLLSIAVTDEPGGYLMPDLAFTSATGGNGLTNQFKKIMRNAGVDCRTVEGSGNRKFSKRSFHSLRHSFASALANAGVAPELRMKLTGHKSAAVHRGYSHHERKTLADAMAKMPSLKAPKK